MLSGQHSGTNGASSGLLFPSDGHSWRRSASLSWSPTPIPSLPALPLPPPPPPPPSPSARPHSGCILHGRGGECGSSRRWWTTVMMSQAHICCPRRRAGGGGVGGWWAALNGRRTADRRAAPVTGPSNEAVLPCSPLTVSMTCQRRRTAKEPVS